MEWVQRENVGVEADDACALLVTGSVLGSARRSKDDSPTFVTVPSEIQRSDLNSSV